MIVSVGTYSDLVAVKALLGQPKALLYHYIPSPEQANLVAIYENGIAFKTGTLVSTPEPVPTPTVIQGDYPEAVSMSFVSVA